MRNFLLVQSRLSSILRWHQWIHRDRILWILPVPRQAEPKMLSVGGEMLACDWLRWGGAGGRGCDWSGGCGGRQRTAAAACWHPSWWRPEPEPRPGQQQPAAASTPHINHSSEDFPPAVLTGAGLVLVTCIDESNWHWLNIHSAAGRGAADCHTDNFGRRGNFGPITFRDQNFARSNQNVATKTWNWRIGSNI